MPAKLTEGHRTHEMFSGVTPRFERLEDVLKRRGIKKSKHHADVLAGLWTEPVKDGRASLYPVHETDVLLAAIAAGTNKEGLRDIVESLHRQRKNTFANIRGSVTASAG